MMITRSMYLTIFVVITILFGVPTNAQESAAPEVLADGALTRILPTGFYFAGQSAPTQMRNAAAARIGKERHVIAGMVDTSGYSTEISGKYEGFFITDSPINIGDKALGTGAYGFGFTNDGKLNLFDISGQQILSVATTNDKDMRRPRPLLMTKAADGLRFYKGRNFVLISIK